MFKKIAPSLLVIIPIAVLLVLGSFGYTLLNKLTSKWNGFPEWGNVLIVFIVFLVLLWKFHSHLKKLPKSVFQTITTVVVIIGILLGIKLIWWAATSTFAESYSSEETEQSAHNNQKGIGSKDRSYGMKLGEPFELEPGAEKAITLPFYADAYYSTTEKLRVRNFSSTVSFTVNKNGSVTDAENVEVQKNTVQTQEAGVVWYIKNLGDKKAQVLVTSSASD
ncbi:MAG TPA: hypothetical protein VLB02_00630 [Candidatus Paceibacterota bacterium]|nr:hypothetical protein [Candidatus Paceibacterota bacterium]